MNELKNGKLLNRKQYKIIQKIGQGGFGITYLAEQIGFYKSTGFGEEYELYKKPKQVVIKELFYDAYCIREHSTGLISVTNSSKKIEFEKLVKNQLEEGKTVRSLKHPNIVRTKDIFNENNTAYMVMEYIDSIGLGRILNEKGVLNKEKAIYYILQILDAVDYFHNHAQKKILHLDIKPSNILIDKTKDKPILIDFGSALSYDSEKNQVISRTSQLITGFTENYAPNEQKDLDNLKGFKASFDTYAIGATLYHMLSGKLPPESGHVSSGYKKLQAPSYYNPKSNISEYLDTVVLKAISPQYPDRFHEANNFKKALKKEKEYNNFLETIKELIQKGLYNQAELKLNEQKNEYIPTKKLETLCNEVIEKRREIEKEKNYQEYLDKAIKAYEHKEYKVALRYFIYAQDEIPKKKEIKTWIEKVNNLLSKKTQTEDIAIALAPIDDIEEAIEREVKEKNLPKEQLPQERQKGATRKINLDKTISTSVLPKGKTKKITKQKKATAYPMGEKTVKIQQENLRKDQKSKKTTTEPKKKKAFFAKYFIPLVVITIIFSGVIVWGLFLKDSKMLTSEPVSPIVIEDSIVTDSINLTDESKLTQLQEQEKTEQPKENNHSLWIDTDGDGVPDYLDKCPDTPKGVKVDANGCPIDTDGDGVPDYLDKCPNEAGPASNDGCPEEITMKNVDEKQAWQKTKKEHTIRAYQNFAKQYPQSSYTQQVEQILQTSFWEKTFGGKDSYSEANSVTITPTGDYLIAGETESKGAGGLDVWLIKTDKNGNKLWEKTFGGKEDDWAGSVTITPTGDYLIAGWTESKGAGRSDAWLIKTDKNGNKLWDKTFGGEDLDGANSVTITPTGDYLIAGLTGSKGAGSYDVWLIKTDKNGNKLWDKTFGGEKWDEAHSVTITPTGDYLIAGYTKSKGAGDYDAWLIKTDKNGNKLWDKTFGGKEDDWARSVTITPTGDYLIAGYTKSKGAGESDAWLIKTDKNGNKIWDKTFGGGSNDMAFFVTITPTGDYLIAGWTDSKGAASTNSWLIKTNKNGNKIWDKTFGRERPGVASSVTITPTGDYLIAGETESKGTGGSDAWLIKTDKNGEIYVP